MRSYRFCSRRSLRVLGEGTFRVARRSAFSALRLRRGALVSSFASPSFPPLEFSCPRPRPRRPRILPRRMNRRRRMSRRRTSRLRRSRSRAPGSAPRPPSRLAARGRRGCPRGCSRGSAGGGCRTRTRACPREGLRADSGEVIGGLGSVRGWSGRRSTDRFF